MKTEITCEPPIWAAKDGSKIPITEMTDLYVVNTLLFLKRKLAALEGETDSAFACSFQGEMASYYGAQGQDAALNREISCRAWVRIFEREIVRRRTLT
jgi:hypothetical protein